MNQPPPIFLVKFLDAQRRTAEEQRLSAGKPPLFQMTDLSGNLIVLPTVEDVAVAAAEEQGGHRCSDKSK